MPGADLDHDSGGTDGDVGVNKGLLIHPPASPSLQYYLRHTPGWNASSRPSQTSLLVGCLAPRLAFPRPHHRGRTAHGHGSGTLCGLKVAVPKRLLVEARDGVSDRSPASMTFWRRKGPTALYHWLCNASEMTPWPRLSSTCSNPFPGNRWRRLRLPGTLGMVVLLQCGCARVTD